MVLLKSPVDSMTLSLSRNQPLHQLHSGPSCIISGLDFGKNPGTDVPASAPAQPSPPAKSILHPTTRVTLSKSKFVYIPSPFKARSLTQSGSPSPYKGLQVSHNLISHSHLIPDASPTTLTLLTPPHQTSLSAFLRRAHTLLPGSFCKCLFL